jgi:acyl-phosphate glycerol 3-phosphate acyltransferase
MLNLPWIFISYLLGSFPSGYLISRWSGKDILKIGWRKTSGSNVFKNVGWWQGALTGILDVFKGYLAVFGAQKLGLPVEIQILSGVAAVTGHNWSLFLKFAGGRGLGTFIGAFFAISPQILGLSLIPLVLLALIFNASIGTWIFLLTAILVSIYFKQLEIAGFFTIISLLPLSIKRLSPIGEILKAKNRPSLIKNRLIFDRDEPPPEWRIKTILRKIFRKRNSGNPGKSSLSQKAKKFFLLSRPLLTTFLLLPPKAAKYGMKAAKAGAEVAKKPIDPVKEILSYGVKKIILRKPEITILEIGIEDLKKMLIAAAKKIVFHQEEINKINVFPVADKDTGYNLAATLLGIEGVISQKEYQSIFELSQDIKEGALMNARGNAGMIFTGYLIRFLDEIKNFEVIEGRLLARAMAKGSKAAFAAILNPVEGTILDTMTAAGKGALEQTRIKKEKDIIRILEKSLEFSQKALEETKEKLEVLKQNDVIDAGGLGFVKILEAWLESLKGQIPAPEPIIPPKEFKEIFQEPLKFRYCFQFSFRNEKPNLNWFREKIKNFGESIEIIESEGIVKAHLHTNQPEVVKKEFQQLPEFKHYLEDMLSQIERVEKKPLGLVVGETADLPKEFLKKYGIEEIPFYAKFPDGEILKRENLYQKIEEAFRTDRPLPTTSAPPFGDFISYYRKALEKFENILVITLSSKLSGAYSSARIARSLLENKKRVTVFDCFSAEVGEGLVAIKAQELISQGKKLDEILEELKKYCPKVRALAIVPDYKYIARSERIKLPHFVFQSITLLQKIGIQFLIGIEKGKIRFLGIRFGRNRAKILAEAIEGPRKNQEMKVAIAQANCPKEAENLQRELEKKEKIEILFISQVSPVIGIYAGPGTLIVGLAPV